MKVISAKRLKLILISIFLGLFVFSFQIAEVEENETIKTKIQHRVTSLTN